MDKPEHLRQVPERGTAQSKWIIPHRYIVTRIRRSRYCQEHKTSGPVAALTVSYRASGSFGLLNANRLGVSRHGTLAFPDLGWVKSLPIGSKALFPR
jgi:hypothetical protein